MGCFLPVIHAPIIGSVSYMAGDGKIVAVLGGLIVVLALCQRVGWAALCGALAAAVAAYDLNAVLAKLSHVPDNPIASLFVKAASPGEAWPVIGLGIVAVLVALFVPEPTAASSVATGDGWYNGSLKD